ncbi:MAG: D-sedoheptulose 7-phosphate isomerase [Rikenellaceae bacterium]|nr:D-sedoheptulose 7-phosphate isomerase [Rikenellaceae bacterium]
MNRINDIERRLAESAEVKNAILKDRKLMEKISQTIDIITNAFNNGSTVYFCGNGGSAADAQHLAAEFSGRFYLDRPSLPSEALHCNTSFLTAISNDYGFEKAYARLLSGIAKKGDILVGISTSGNSANIVRAFEECREMGVFTIGLTGDNGGEMKKLCDILLNVPSSDTPRVQESQITIGHIICELVEANIFG